MPKENGLIKNLKTLGSTKTMNAIFSTKDRTGLFIEEDVSKDKITLLAFEFDQNDRTINARIVRDEEEEINFKIDSLDVMEAIAGFFCEKMGDVIEQMKSGKLKQGDNVVENDVITKLILNMPSGNSNSVS